MSNAPLLNIAMVLRETRVRRGISRSALVRSLGIDRRSLNHWENGSTSPTLGNAEKWARALGMKIELREQSLSPNSPQGE